MRPFLLVSLILCAVGVSANPIKENPLPTTTTFTPNVQDAKPVSKEDLCACGRSPAKEATRVAFQGFRTAKLYMLAAIINVNPTHDELQEAAKWQLGETLKLLKTAKELNCKDHSKVRRKWYKSRFRWLKFKVKVAKKLIKKGLPSWPWLARVLEWFKKKQGKMQARWNKLNARVDRKLNGYVATPVEDKTATPHVNVEDVVMHTEPMPVDVPKEHLIAAVEQETPPLPPKPEGQPKQKAEPATAEKDDAHMIQAVNQAVEKADVEAKVVEAKVAEAKAAEATKVEEKKGEEPKKKIIYLPKVNLMKAPTQVVDDAILEKLGKKMALDVAKVDVVLHDIDTKMVC